MHEVGGVLISDEVQAGVFRTGKPFAIQRAGVVPDIMSLAKGIAGGVPAGPCVARVEVADAFKPGDHGSTFGGSCLAVAAAESTLCELVNGGYPGKAGKVGAYMAEQLEKVPHVVEVRGGGPQVLGCDLDEGAGDAHDVVTAALEAGAVINAMGAHTLRFLPPLICTRRTWTSSSRSSAASSNDKTNPVRFITSPGPLRRLCRLASRAGKDARALCAARDPAGSNPSVMGMKMKRPRVCRVNKNYGGR